MFKKKEKFALKMKQSNNRKKIVLMIFTQANTLFGYNGLRVDFFSQFKVAAFDFYLSHQSFSQWHYPNLKVSQVFSLHEITNVHPLAKHCKALIHIAKRIWTIQTFSYSWSHSIVLLCYFLITIWKVQIKIL